MQIPLDKIIHNTVAFNLPIFIVVKSRKAAKRRYIQGLLPLLAVLALAACPTDGGGSSPGDLLPSTYTVTFSGNGNTSGA
jgi:uncharacterized membrane protein (GlpM family)